MRDLGQISQLFIANASSKTGLPAPRGYDPAVMIEVEAIRITARGPMGWHNGTWLPDVHHRDHPQSRNRDNNDISLNFTSHYQRMTERFGPRITPGCAGENIIVTSEMVVALDQIAGGIEIRGQDGLVKLESVMAAPPCAPFSGWALGIVDPEPHQVKATLQFLQHGVRGFYVKYTGDDIVIRLGDAVVSV